MPPRNERSEMEAGPQAWFNVPVLDKVHAC